MGGGGAWWLSKKRTQKKRPNNTVLGRGRRGKKTSSNLSEVEGKKVESQEPIRSGEEKSLALKKNS